MKHYVASVSPERSKDIGLSLGCDVINISNVYITEIDLMDSEIIFDCKQFIDIVSDNNNILNNHYFNIIENFAIIHNIPRRYVLVD